MIDVNNKLKPFLLFGMMISSWSALCQGPMRGHHSDRPPHNSELREEMHKYFEQNILPILLEKRGVFEAELISEEKAVIDHARANRPPFSKRGRGPRPNRDELDDKTREEMHSWKMEMQGAKTALMEIVDNHQGFFDNFRDELAVYQETWKEDMAAIRSEYLTDELGPSGRKKRRFGHRGPGVMGPAGRPLRFLLLDATDDNLDQEMSFKIFPNPTLDVNRIEYQVMSPGEVTIKILDEQGKEVEIILNEIKQLGKYSIETSLSNAPGSVFYYQVTSPSGTDTRRILKGN